jgi:aspartyl-tRNA(Asn)/glutamyl-tRNA(Gln) amidotransferase subunit A
MLGTYTLSSGYYDAYYKKALKVRTLIKDDFLKAFGKVDVVLGPTSPCLPWKIGEKSDDPMSMYLADIYTVSVNLAGLPGISVPCGSSNGLPIGIQLIGNVFEEEKLLAIASLFEKNYDNK